VLDAFVADRDDDVAELDTGRALLDAAHAGFFRRRAAHHAEHDDAAEARSLLESMGGVDLHPDADLLGVSRLQDLWDDPHDRGNGNCEADARRGTAPTVDERVHADEPPARVEQGT